MSLKRSADDEPKSGHHKRVKVDTIEECQKKETLSNDDCNRQEQDLSKPVPPLLTLSDEILLYIIRFLDPRDVINLGRACLRLSSVVRDRALWAWVDLRRRPMMLCQLPAFLPFLRPCTRALLSRGPAPLPPSPRRRRDPRRCSPAAALRALAATCPSLESLHAQRHCYDASKVNLTDFPSSLKKLDLEGCEVHFVSKDLSYFRGINNHMVLLQELVLDGCQWLSADCLMAISKCPALRRLSLRHCRNVGACYVYISLSTRFGFKALEELDVRGTALVDHEISCFQNVNSLTHLLLEPPPRWAPREYSYHSDDCENGSHSRKVPCSLRSKDSAGDASGEAESGAEDGDEEGEEEKEEQEEEEEEEEDEEACAWRGEPRCRCPPASPSSPPSTPPPTNPFSPPPHLPIVHINLFDPHATPTHAHAVGACPCEGPEGAGAEDVAAQLCAGGGGDGGGVSDRGLLALGTRVVLELDAAAPAQPQLLHRNPRLRALTVANCPRVTNASLRHLAMHEPLKFLDVRGAGVTRQGVELFASLRPDVSLLHSHPAPLEQ